MRAKNGDRRDEREMLWISDEPSGEADGVRMNL